MMTKKEFKEYLASCDVENDNDNIWVDEDVIYPEKRKLFFQPNVEKNIEEEYPFEASYQFEYYLNDEVVDESYQGIVEEWFDEMYEQYVETCK